MGSSRPSTFEIKFKMAFASRSMMFASRAVVAGSRFQVQAAPRLFASSRYMSTFFTKDHEWIKVDGSTATVGISSHAADQLGDIVYVELPEVGKELEQGDSFGVAESVKAASDVYTPHAGEVVEVNEALEEEPSLINKDAMGEGWMMKLKISGPPEGLMDEAAYAKYCEEADDH